jgi:hypothetical protein
MTKVKKGVDYSKVTPALVKQVKDVIADAEKHTYSVSKVYAAHNAAFGLREQPQTCSSCLRNRARDLRDWLKGYNEYAKAKPEMPPAGNEGGKAQGGDVKPDPQYDNPEAPGYVAQVEGTVRYPMAEGIPFDFLPNEGTLVKGTVTRADRSKVKPGTYVTAGGLKIVVQPGGKANIKDEDGTPFDEEDLT